MEMERDATLDAEQSVQDVILELLDSDPSQETAVKDAVLEALAHVADVAGDCGDALRSTVLTSVGHMAEQRRRCG
jgi:hypothetical protein